MGIYGYVGSKGSTLLFDMAKTPCLICNGFMTEADDCTRVNLLEGGDRLYYSIVHTVCYRKLTPIQRDEVQAIGLQAIALDCDLQASVQRSGTVN